MSINWFLTAYFSDMYLVLSIKISSCLFVVLLNSFFYPFPVYQHVFFLIESKQPSKRKMLLVFFSWILHRINYNGGYYLRGWCLPLSKQKLKHSIPWKSSLLQMITKEFLPNDSFGTGIFGAFLMVLVLKFGQEDTVWCWPFFSISWN